MFSVSRIRSVNKLTPTPGTLFKPLKKRGKWINKSRLGYSFTTFIKEEEKVQSIKVFATTMKCVRERTYRAIVTDDLKAEPTGRAEANKKRSQYIHTTWMRECT